MSVDVNAGVPEQSRWILEAHNIDPIVTRLAFWDTNGSFHGIYQSWGEYGGDQWQMGHSMAFFAAAFCVGKMYELDIDAPTDHFVRVIKPPEGEAPLDVREEVEGTEFFIRSALQTEPNIIRVYPPDLVLALLSRGKIHAAMWYRNNMNERLLEGTEVLYWDFQEDDIHVYSPEPNPGVSYDWYLNTGNLRLLRDYEPRFLRLVPNSILNPTNPHKYMDDSSEKELVRKLDQGLAEGRGRAEIIQRFVTGRVLNYFASAYTALQEEVADETQGLTVGHNMTTGEVEYYRHFATVLIDRLAGVDLSGDPRYAQLFRNFDSLRLSPEQIRARQEEDERRKQFPPPVLPDVTMDLLDFHLRRHYAGL